MLSTLHHSDQASELRVLVNKHLREENHGETSIITFISGKGGVGKSTIALNTAAALALRGKNVLLIDGNINRGSLDVMLGIAPKERLSNFLRNEIDLEDAITKIFPHLYLLPETSAERDYPSFHSETAAQIIFQAQNTNINFDFILVDTPSGINNESIGFSLVANEIIVVSTSEPASIMDSYAVIKYLYSYQVPQQLFLLFNNIITPNDAEDSAAKLNMAIEHFLRQRIEYLGYLPTDSTVVSSAYQQQAWKVNAPDSAISKALETIIEKILVLHSNHNLKVSYE